MGNDRETSSRLGSFLFFVAGVLGSVFVVVVLIVGVLLLEAWSTSGQARSPIVVAPHPGVAFDVVCEDPHDVIGYESEDDVVPVFAYAQRVGNAELVRIAFCDFIERHPSSLTSGRWHFQITSGKTLEICEWTVRDAGPDLEVACP